MATRHLRQATITFTPSTSGTYTLICSQDITGPGNSYSLTITGAGSVGTKTTILQGLDLPPANLNITVIVTALGGTPTGNVTLSLDGGAGITQALSGGQTVFSIPNPVPGFQTVTAVYAGALPTYLPSSASISLTTGYPQYQTRAAREGQCRAADHMPSVRRWSRLLAL